MRKSVGIGLGLLVTGGTVWAQYLITPVAGGGIPPTASAALSAPLPQSSAVAVDGLLGYGLYYLLNFREESALKRARRNLVNSIRELDTQHEVAKRYEIFRTYTGGELLTAELQLLLASYASPKEFWNDYYAVRKADPTTPAAPCARRSLSLARSSIAPTAPCTKGVRATPKRMLARNAKRSADAKRSTLISKTPS